MNSLERISDIAIWALSQLKKSSSQRNSNFFSFFPAMPSHLRAVCLRGGVFNEERLPGYAELLLNVLRQIDRRSSSTIQDGIEMLLADPEGYGGLNLLLGDLVGIHAKDSKE